MNTFTLKLKSLLEKQVETLQEVIGGIEMDNDDSELWTALEDLTAAHYDNFKDEVTKLYNEYSGE